MLNTSDILETIRMIQDECLDIRTITMGISLLDCCASDMNTVCDRVYEKITRLAEHLVETGQQIETEYGIPIINKRISITPAAMLVSATRGGDPVLLARTLQRAAETTGVNFIGGFSALVHKGFSAGDEALIRAIPQALAETKNLCASVNIGSTKAGINMDAVRLMGEIVREAAEATADQNCFGPAKLVILCNAPEDNPFMAGAFHGVGEPDCEVHVGVSGPGVVRAAIEKYPMLPLMSLPISSSAPRSRSPVWVSWSVPVLPRCSACRLALSISRSRRRRQSVIPLRIFSKAWGFPSAVCTARRQRLPCSTMLSKRAA